MTYWTASLERELSKIFDAENGAVMQIDRQLVRKRDRLLPDLVFPLVPVVAERTILVGTAPLTS